jgi:predicted  nucleic acid-binding Zn-ribbon protein
MNKCVWCGTDYEWSDRVASALCAECASENAQSLAEDTAMTDAWDADDDAMLRAVWEDIADPIA